MTIRSTFTAGSFPCARLVVSEECEFDFVWAFIARAPCVAEGLISKLGELEGRACLLFAVVSSP